MVSEVSKYRYEYHWWVVFGVEKIALIKSFSAGLSSFI
jgi:hypothetical protein